MEESKIIRAEEALFHFKCSECGAETIESLERVNKIKAMHCSKCDRIENFLELVGISKNPEKVGRPHPWPDPPVLNKKSLPEFTIQCPECNDREHKVTIIVTELIPNEESQGLVLECDNCKAKFSLIRCSLKIS